jgi:hypothetical protein
VNLQRTSLLLVALLALALPIFAQEGGDNPTGIQFQNAGTNAFFGSGYFKANVQTGFTANNGVSVTPTCTYGGIPIDSSNPSILCDATF